VSDDGSVSRKTVLKVLQLNGVDISEIDDGQSTFFKFAKANDPSTLRAIPLPEIVNRRMVRNFSRWYNVAIHYFYNPDMIPSSHGLFSAPPTDTDTHVAEVARSSWTVAEPSSVPIEKADQTGPEDEKK
jgi:hypothetical protein